ncbi:MAG TPA: hypothetical protein PK649_05720 [Vicingus sp.]|nr:hypothetical protein [Vicingus sp.]HRP59869.1 hypothetical protein [Vicingus sp.]
MNKSILFLLLSLSILYSCNYIPCRGQDYIIEGITHKELIEKLNKLRSDYSEYYSNDDHINKHVPLYYIALSWKDLNLVIDCEVFIGDKIPTPPAYLKFRGIRPPLGGYTDINSKELDKKLNEVYINKFESEILSKLDVKWKRDPCW